MVEQGLSLTRGNVKAVEQKMLLPKTLKDVWKFLTYLNQQLGMDGKADKHRI